MLRTLPVLHRFARLLASLVFVLAASVPAGAAAAPATLFDAVEGAWAVGTMRLGKPLQFRDGLLLAFPTQVVDLLHARQGKPRHAMLLLEVPEDEKDKPFFAYEDEFLAPLRLLSERAYWRDNLPSTTRHEVAGGRRNVFRGEEMAAATQAIEPFAEALAKEGREKRLARVVAVALALSNGVDRIREDASRYLAALPALGRDFSEAAKTPIATYLAGSAPATERAALIDAIGRARIVSMRATLEALAGGSRDEVVATAAREALQRMDEAGTPAGEATPAALPAGE